MDENHLKTLRILSDKAEVSQRELAKALNLSLGKANYIMNALIKKGYIKVLGFKNSRNKRSYKYYLTPEGIKKKLELTYQYFRVKSQEYEVLKKEIMKLEDEIKNHDFISEASNSSPSLIEAILDPVVGPMSQMKAQNK